jgi:hypothetical protein
MGTLSVPHSDETMNGRRAKPAFRFSGYTDETVNFQLFHNMDIGL